MILLIIILIASMLWRYINIAPVLPDEAAETLQIYIHASYNTQVDIEDFQLLDKQSDTETWCVKTNPVGGYIYWKLVRIGAFRWDVFPITLRDIKSTLCNL